MRENNYIAIIYEIRVFYNKITCISLNKCLECINYNFFLNQGEINTFPDKQKSEGVCYHQICSARNAKESPVIQHKGTLDSS